MSYAMQYNPTGIITAGSSPAPGSYIRVQGAPAGMTVYGMAKLPNGTLSGVRIPADEAPAAGGMPGYYHLPVDRIVGNPGATTVGVQVVAAPANGPMMYADVGAGDGVTPVAWSEFRDGSGNPNADYKYIAYGVGALAVVGLAYALWPKGGRHENPRRRR